MPKKSVRPLSRWLQPPLEADFALNERWLLGSRQVQTIVKRVAGHSGVGSKSWIDPFRGDMQKTPGSVCQAEGFARRLQTECLHALALLLGTLLEEIKVDGLQG